MTTVSRDSRAVPAGNAANASRYVVFIQGGGECRNKPDCDRWYVSHGGNSSLWPATRSVRDDHGDHAEMDTDCDANPDFCSWSKVYIPYCTGDMCDPTPPLPTTAGC